MKFKAGLAVLMASLAVGPAHAQQRCLQPAERTALHVKVLQSDLMVAALSCRDVPGFDYRGAYNTFMQRHGTGVSRHMATLQGHFRAAYGGQWQNRFDQSPPRSPTRRRASRCRASASASSPVQVMQWAMQITAESLGSSADMFAQSRGVRLQRLPRRVRTRAPGSARCIRWPQWSKARPARPGPVRVLIPFPAIARRFRRAGSAPLSSDRASERAAETCPSHVR